MHRAGETLNSPDVRRVIIGPQISSIQGSLTSESLLSLKVTAQDFTSVEAFKVTTHNETQILVPTESC